MAVTYQKMRLDDVAMYNIVSFISDIDDRVAVAAAISGHSTVIDTICQTDADLCVRLKRSAMIPYIIKAIAAVDDRPIYAVIMIAIIYWSLYAIVSIFTPFAYIYSFNFTLLIWLGIVTIHTNLPDILCDQVTTMEHGALMCMCRMGSRKLMISNV